MNFYIQTDSKVPIYEQIVEEVKKALLDGSLQEGQQLPSIRVLARELEISVITTKRAYEELEKEKLIASVKGKGFFALAPNRNKLQEQQFANIEGKLLELIVESKKIGLTKSDFIMLVSTLYEG